jgi:hypothetical protein
MRVYHLLPEDRAFNDLKRRRLKVSRFDDMNDPFELLAVSLKTKRHRAALRGIKTEMDRQYGALCFSRHWRNPMLWSHYAAKHRGICLGFDVPKRLAQPVNYNADRLELDIERQLARSTRDIRLGLKLLTTKYAGWEYEDEVRAIVRLSEPDTETGFYFCDFGPQLALKEVIVGPRSLLSRSAVSAALSKKDVGVSLLKARLALKTFSVVLQLNSALWPK